MPNVCCRQGRIALRNPDVFWFYVLRLGMSQGGKCSDGALGVLSLVARASSGPQYTPRPPLSVLSEIPLF